MNILLIAATFQEIGIFASAHSKNDILISGVGCAGTIYHLQKKLQQKRYDLVVQAGIAGCFSNKCKLEEVVAVQQDTYGDLGAEEKEDFTTIFEMGLANKDEFPFQNGWLINNSEHLEKITLQKVKAVTVNKVSDRKIQTEQLIKKFNPDIESMEGAAFHYVCLQEKTSFLQLRSISNYVGERNNAKWKMKEAIINLNVALEKILPKLK